MSAVTLVGKNDHNWDRLDKTIDLLRCMEKAHNFSSSGVHGKHDLSEFDWQKKADCYWLIDESRSAQLTRLVTVLVTTG